MTGDSERTASGRLRLPPSIDVPLTPRVARIIDTPAMRRLRKVSQLGLVAWVYPGATHHRFEHSLGVYATAVALWRHLEGDPAFAALAGTDQRALDAFLLAALTHDLGHWPYGHPIEDLGEMPGRAPTLRHEARAEELLRSEELGSAIRDDWACSIDDVMSILQPRSYQRRAEAGEMGLRHEQVQFFASCLSGPIDIDKLDYLQRDSLHAGVPYGRHFDPNRLIASLRVHPNQPSLALDVKGRTAAEMMVFGRYVMFSEVYWHHAVRAATAMLQRTLFELVTVDASVVDWTQWSDYSDESWERALIEAVESDGRAGLRRLSDGLFGNRRRLYKRLAEYNVLSIESGALVLDQSLHRRLARRPYWWLVRCAHILAELLSRGGTMKVDPLEVLIDAPPVKLEVDINMDVIEPSGRVLSLGEISPVASVLAHRQFDNHVKRVRVFATPRVRDHWGDASIDSLLHQAVDTVEQEWA